MRIILLSISQLLRNFNLNAAREERFLRFLFLPSLIEGNPTVMFESIGCGKPFIGTDVGGIPEVIISNKYGLLCEPQNSAKLVENILEALEKKWSAIDIVEYSKQFRWDIVAEKIAIVYQKTNL